MMGVLWQAATARGRHHRDGWRKEEDGGGWGRWWWRSSGGAPTGQGRGVQLDYPTMPGGTSTSWGEQQRSLKRKNRKTNVKMLNCTHVYYWLQDSSWYKILTAEIYITYTAYVWKQIKGFFFFPQNGQTCRVTTKIETHLAPSTNPTHPRFKADPAVFRQYNKDWRFISKGTVSHFNHDWKPGDDIIWPDFTSPGWFMCCKRQYRLVGSRAATISCLINRKKRNK